MPSVADLVEDHLLRALTDPETYDAGRALADHGAVAFEQFGPMNVRARVADGELYYVDLRVGPGKLAWSCSEPGGSRGDFCRHCVAAAVQTWRQAPAKAARTPTAEDAGSAAGLPVARPPDIVRPVVVETPVAEALLTAPPPPAELPPSAEAPAVVPAAAAELPAPAELLSGVHAILFSPLADELRAFLRDKLRLPSVDAGDGWLIFALPPAELAVHPAERPDQGLYLLCDDLEATLAELERRGVTERTPIRQESWGFVTELRLPDGSQLPLYQPTHARPTPR
jgi:hypothetical protein